MRMLACALFCLPVLSVAALAAEPLTTRSLVSEMADLARLADFPDPTFETVQFSSYDRRSKAPNTPGWYANSDGFGGEPIPGFLRVLKPPDADEAGEYLMAEVNGPGAIVRTWTAAISGQLRVFLDDSDSPLYDGAADGFLLDKYGHYARQLGLPTEKAADAFHQRDADYFPIPFAEGCRIIWKGKLSEIHFYHVQIRKYPPGTEVRTFQPEDLRTYREDITGAVSLLLDPDLAFEGVPVKEKMQWSAHVGPGMQMKPAKVDRGPAAARMLSLKVEAENLRDALRETILRIRFDGAPMPQVESPVGDFFGAAPGINPCESLPMTVNPDGTMICRFVMPFAHDMSLWLDNRGRQSVRISGEVLVSPYDWRPDRSMHFRARWRVNHDLLALPGDGAYDVPFLVARGKGVYVGTAVMIMNPSPVPTAYGNWWGEGDEKVFVDGQDFPSTFGTGSEDYFNYSWSNCELFDHPYCAQPIVTGPDTRGYISNSRWHILDALPFNQEIAFYMELYSHRPTPSLSYGRIAYHYASPGIRDDWVPIMDCDARVAPLPRDWQPVASHGSAGSIFYQAESLERKCDGEAKIVDGELWSGGKLLIWRPAKKGERLSLALDVEQQGRYAIVMTSSMTPQSGSFRAKCDGRQLSRNQDETALNLRSSHQVMLRNFAWNPIDLSTGKHVIELEALSETGPDSAIGIDFFWLQPRR